MLIEVLDLGFGARRWYGFGARFACVQSVSVFGVCRRLQLFTKVSSSSSKSKSKTGFCSKNEKNDKKIQTENIETSFVELYH